MTLAHNRGDLKQGMGFWKNTPLHPAGVSTLPREDALRLRFASINTRGFPPKAIATIRCAR